MLIDASYPMQPINPPGSDLKRIGILLFILQSFPGGGKTLGVVCAFFSSLDGFQPCKHVLRHGGNHKEIDLLVAVWTTSGGPLERSSGAWCVCFSPQDPD